MFDKMDYVKIIRKEIGEIRDILRAFDIHVEMVKDDLGGGTVS